jgi:cytochrome c553
MRKHSLAPLCIALLTAIMAAASTGFGQGPVTMPQPLGIAADAAHGAVIGETCLGCHGVPGYRNTYPSYRVPKLGGQHREYLEVALQGYRAGLRPHDSMHGQAASLSDQDIADLAAFFASFEGRPSTGRPLRRGASAARGADQVATCVACHGQEGIAPAAMWPSLAGQHASYLVHALEEYQSGARADVLMGPMIAGLSAQDIADIAAYYAAQPGLYSTVR